MSQHTRLLLTRTHRILIALVVSGAIIIAGIGFAGSYSAVRALAERKGFGQFSVVFPIGIDAGICVLLALDLLLTWIRIPFPLLRQTAWLLTLATIAFNGAAAWPNPLGVGMHAVIPVLFVVTVEAARHAVGRIADITADKHMEGVRITRWLLSPLPTFLLWRRMKLWELRSYEQTIRLEQERLIYQARLRSRFGRAWRRKAPIESLMPLRLARYGVPLAETAPAGLTAAGIEPALLTPPVNPNSLHTKDPQTPPLPGNSSHEEAYFQAFRNYVNENGDWPNAQQLDLHRNGQILQRDVAPRNATPPQCATPHNPTPATQSVALPVASSAALTTPAPRNTKPPFATHEDATPAERTARDAVEEAARTVAADLDDITLLTTAQVARLKGVTQGTVRSWVKRGHLTPARRDAHGRNHFHPAAVAEID